ncbi:MAG: LytTR family transcriptional regulator DNA-binding domain-containing protein [Bacteroidia bacterium]|jgi:two-component system LytT family response regulator
MIKCIVIDDEPLARSIVLEYLQNYENIQVVQECGDGFEGLKAIQEHKPELVFLDVQMPKVSGFEMLEILEEPPAVIFTTAFDEYALKAFDANAVDYLLKPFSRERFDRALQKWMQTRDMEAGSVMERIGDQVLRQPEEHERVVVKNGSNIRIIPVHEIDYFEAYDDYVKIHVNDGYYLKKKTMNYFESVLDPGKFVRAHRSFIVQIPQITRIEPYEKEGYVALLKNGKRVPLSKTGYGKLKAVLGL